MEGPQKMLLVFSDTLGQEGAASCTERADAIHFRQAVAVPAEGGRPARYVAVAEGVVFSEGAPDRPVQLRSVVVTDHLVLPRPLCRPRLPHQQRQCLRRQPEPQAQPPAAMETETPDKKSPQQQPQQQPGQEQQQQQTQQAKRTVTVDGAWCDPAALRLELPPAYSALRSARPQHLVACTRADDDADDAALLLGADDGSADDALRLARAWPSLPARCLRGCRGLRPSARWASRLAAAGHVDAACALVRALGPADPCGFADELAASGGVDALARCCCCSPAAPEALRALLAGSPSEAAVSAVVAACPAVARALAAGECTVLAARAAVALLRDASDAESRARWSRSARAFLSGGSSSPDAPDCAGLRALAAALGDVRGAGDDVVRAAADVLCSAPARGDPAYPALFAAAARHLLGLAASGAGADVLARCSGSVAAVVASLGPARPFESPRGLAALDVAALQQRSATAPELAHYLACYVGAHCEAARLRCCCAGAGDGGDDGDDDGNAVSASLRALARWCSTEAGEDAVCRALARTGSLGAVAAALRRASSASQAPLDDGTASLCVFVLARAAQSPDVVESLQCADVGALCEALASVDAERLTAETAALAGSACADLEPLKILRDRSVEGLLQWVSGLKTSPSTASLDTEGYLRLCTSSAALLASNDVLALLQFCVSVLAECVRAKDAPLRPCARAAASVLRLAEAVAATLDAARPFALPPLVPAVLDAYAHFGAHADSRTASYASAELAAALARRLLLAWERRWPAAVHAGAADRLLATAASAARPLLLGPAAHARAPALAQTAFPEAHARLCELLAGAEAPEALVREAVALLAPVALADPCAAAPGSSAHVQRLLCLLLAAAGTARGCGALAACDAVAALAPLVSLDAPARVAGAALALCARALLRCPAAACERLLPAACDCACDRVLLRASAETAARGVVCEALAVLRAACARPAGAAALVRALGRSAWLPVLRLAEALAAARASDARGAVCEQLCALLRDVARRPGAPAAALSAFVRDNAPLLRCLGDAMPAGSRSRAAVDGVLACAVDEQGCDGDGDGDVDAEFSDDCEAPSPASPSAYDVYVDAHPGLVAEPRQQSQAQPQTPAAQLQAQPMGLLPTPGAPSQRPLTLCQAALLEDSLKRARVDGKAPQAALQQAGVVLRAPGAARKDTFRTRKPNTSRPPSIHVDQFEDHKEAPLGAAALQQPEGLLATPVVAQPPPPQVAGLAWAAPDVHAALLQAQVIKQMAALPFVVPQAQAQQQAGVAVAEAAMDVRDDGATGWLDPAAEAAQRMQAAQAQAMQAAADDKAQQQQGGPLRLVLQTR
eukprot:m51a1_g10269 hypothetical protein (1324) ;mRNA; r:36321-41183